jgi:hypothetical protein
LIPSNVEIIGSDCFYWCESLSSVTFESHSQLTRIESRVFSESSLQSILIASSILFIASDAVKIASQTCVIDGDSCPEFDRWLQLKRSGIVIDFRRIQRMGFDVPCLGDYIVNVSEFEERSPGDSISRNVCSEHFRVDLARDSLLRSLALAE